MKSAVCLIVLCVVTSVGCSKPTEIADKVEQIEPQSQPTPDESKPPIYVHIASMTSDELCDRLISIDTMPSRDPNITDPIYESLIAKGGEAVPCLVEKISDTTAMPDPRYSVPHWQHFKAGDAAVIILLDIVTKDDQAWEKLMTESLPPKYAEEWETNGIYAYFNYVSEPKNRRKLQEWWKNWLKENSKVQSLP